MKLGFVSAILDGWSFEEMIDTARDLGFSCVEAACWPSGKAERRYAGVSHIDVDGLTDEKSAYILGYCKERGVELSSLAFYPNTMDEDLEKRAANIAHLKKVILASEKLGVGMVTTFVGRATHKTVEENLELFREIWPPIVAFAEEHHVKVAIENCPMWFDATNWPGGQNLFTTPDIWRRCFEILPSPSFGINYDPSHFIWQQMDYIRPLYEFKDRIFHVHYKDIKLYPEKLARVGVMAYPLQYMEPKLPGLGDVNWAKYVSALTDIGYSGYTCIEVEDRAFEGSRERILDSLRLSKPDGFLSHYFSLRDLRREGLSTASGAAEGGPLLKRRILWDASSRSTPTATTAIPLSRPSTASPPPGSATSSSPPPRAGRSMCSPTRASSGCGR